MKRNVSVVCVCSASNCCNTEQRSASQPGSVASGTHCIIECSKVSFKIEIPKIGLLAPNSSVYVDFSGV